MRARDNCAHAVRLVRCPVYTARNHPDHPLSLPQLQKIGPCIESVAIIIEMFLLGSPRVSAAIRAVKLDHWNMFRVPQPFRVFCVKALGLDADLTPNTERTMCGFVGMTLLFRGLIRLWWYLDLDLLIRVLIITMDVLLS